VEAMAQAYPFLSSSTDPDFGFPNVAWEGWLQPLRTIDHIDAILADLEDDRPLVISNYGELLHDPDCNRFHSSHRLTRRLRNRFPLSRIKVTYNGNTRHPRAYRIEPPIEFGSKHTFLSDGRLCLYAPWKGAWRHDRNTVADFTDQVVIWLAKRSIWETTGVWLGREVSHSPVSVFADIEVQAECWCGLGNSYGSCHRQLDWKRIVEGWLVS
jgi:hypothetical protein